MSCSGRPMQPPMPAPAAGRIKPQGRKLIGRESGPKRDGLRREDVEQLASVSRRPSGYGGPASRRSNCPSYAMSRHNRAPTPVARSYTTGSRAPSRRTGGSTCGRDFHDRLTDIVSQFEANETDQWEFLTSLKGLADSRPVTNLRRTDSVQKPSELFPGAIISAPCHSQAREGVVDGSSRNLAATDFGSVYSKYRKYVVLSEKSEHFVCAPIYSYNGRGISHGRRARNRDEYFSIRDSDDPSPEPSETDEDPLMAVRDRHWPLKNAFIAGLSNVKFTEVCSISYDSKCSLEGYLLEPSFQRLYERYMVTH